MIKLALVGLDGATFRIIKPLCNEGKLPNLKKLITKGVHGLLESTFPPVTGPAWSALATGKNPGRTGIFDTVLPAGEQRFNTRIVTSDDIRRARAYWDYLSDAGVRVGVVNYPFLYPPYRLNGMMVSGLGSRPHDDIFYPGELRQAIEKECGQYRITVPWRNARYTRNTQLFIKDIFKLLEINRKTLKFLLQTDIEVLTFVISASDFAQHYMWRYIDPYQLHFEKAEAEEYYPAFVELWQGIDDILGMMLETLPKEANVLLVSDHGFGPNRSYFYTNSWLEKEGYLFRKRLPGKITVLSHMARRLVRKVPYISTRLATLPAMKRLVWTADMLPIDMERSLAFSPANASLTGKICINKSALSRSGQGYTPESLRNEIIQKLEETCRDLGLQLKVYLPDDLYNGHYLKLAPDIMFEIDEFECSIRYVFHQGSFHEPADDPVHSGIHKREGILIVHGPDINQGAAIEGARIYDIAPTILHMFGLPVPTDMDGEVLHQIFRKDSEVARRPIKYQEIDVEEVRIKDRIRKLRKAGKL
jgi:predicted AlkP superfamily phosphohydrolase/phosphomutase